MSQNFWATIMPFGPMTLIFYWPKKKIPGSHHCSHCNKEISSSISPPPLKMNMFQLENCVSLWRKNNLEKCQNINFGKLCMNLVLNMQK